MAEIHWLRDGQQWPQARPKRAALKGRANSELRNSPTRPQGGAAPKKQQYKKEKKRGLGHKKREEQLLLSFPRGIGILLTNNFFENAHA